jgi:histidinol-phosphate aminotransferase
MTATKPDSRVTVRGALSTARLDLTRNPFGPCPAALEALEARDGHLPADVPQALSRQLGITFRVPREAIVLTEGADAGLAAVVRALDGPLVLVPPSTLATMVAASEPSRPVHLLARGPGRLGSVPADVAGDLPVHGVAVVDSPTDPLGAVLRPQNAVRLARGCRWLVVDERFAEFGGTSLLPLALEFPNIVVIRSFAAWAGIAEPGVGWVMGPPALRQAICGTVASPSPRAVAAALATLEHLADVEATLRVVRAERSRLFRLLRKFSFLQPLPSWGPYLAARVELVDRDTLVVGLASRGVCVDAPPEPGLERFVRIGIGTRREMQILESALRELAPELVS